MTSSPFAALAGELDRALRGRFLGRVHRPDAWTLGIEAGDRSLLGFCWLPGSLAAGNCGGPWPKGNIPDLLRANLQGARVASVEAFPGEPILLVRTAGGAALVFEALGRSSNLLLLDSEGRILWAARTLGGTFRTGRRGELWTPPPPRPKVGSHPRPEPPIGGPAALLGGLAGRFRTRALAGLRAREKAALRRREAVRGDLEEGRGWSALDALGKALLASGDLGRRGATSKTVMDFEKDPPAEVQLALDPALTARENAEALFRRARKGRARMDKAGRILDAIGEELVNLASAREEVVKREDADLLDAEVGRETPKSATKGGEGRRLPRGVVAVPLPDGFAGFAGKDAAGNSAVSFRIGRGADFWFHAADYPGSHVVVRNPDRSDSLRTDVERAAALYAARHSQAPPGNRIAVTAARCKDLRPAPGSPGQVFLSGGRTLFVDLPGR